MVKYQKVRFKDSTICTIWIPFKDSEAGHCFDFSEEELDSILEAVKSLKDLPAEEYVEDPKYEEFLKKRTEKESKWYYKLWEFLDDFIVQIRPFNWSLRLRRDSKRDLTFSFMSSSSGFQIGPLLVSLPRLKRKD